MKVDEWILCVTPLRVVAINSGSNWQMFVPWRRTPRPCVLHRSRGFITMPLGSQLQCNRRKKKKDSILLCLAAILGCKCWRQKASRASPEGQGLRRNSKVEACKCFIDGVSFHWCLDVSLLKKKKIWPQASVSLKHTKRFLGNAFWTKQVEVSSNYHLCFKHEA